MMGDPISFTLGIPREGRFKFLPRKSTPTLMCMRHEAKPMSTPTSTSRAWVGGR